MALALSIFGVAFAATCVWLTVRVINRHERWAKWTLTMVAALPVFYVLSFGPASWIASRIGGGHSPMMSAAYRPLIWAWHKCPEGRVNSAIWRYLTFGMDA